MKNNEKSFMFKGRDCVRQLTCFSADTTVHTLDRNAPIFGINDNIDYNSEYRQLNSELRSNLIQDLVKFWMATPAVKFRFLVISFQKYIGQNSKKFTDDEQFRTSILTLFIALFQQILIEIAPEIIKRKPIGTILRLTQISRSEAFQRAVKKFDMPYQKSLMSQDSMHYVNQNISESSSKEYKAVIEELINLLTINIK